MKRWHIVPLSLLALAVLAVSLWLPFRTTVRASSEVVSISVKVNNNPALDHDPGYYYVSQWVGTGTKTNPYRPAIADLVKEYSAIDLRPNPSSISGYAFVFSQELVSDSKLRLLTDNLFTDLLDMDLVYIKGITGATDITAKTLPDVIYQLLATPTKRANIGNPVVPENDGKVRLWLGGQIYGDAVKMGSTTITDSFNRADADALGTSSEGWSWVEAQNDIDIVSNQAKSQTASADHLAYANASEPLTPNHYAQAKVWLGGAVHAAGPGARVSTSALTYYAFHTDDSANRWVMFSVVADAWTELGQNTVSWATPAGATIKITANGSSIIGYQDGASKVSVTNTAINGNKKAGITGYDSNNIWDDFQASDLYTAGFPYIVNFSTGSQNTDSTTHALTLPAGVDVGDLLLALFSVDANEVPTINGGWSRLGYGQYSTTVTGAIFYKVATGSDAATVTTTSEQSTHIVLQIKGASGTIYGASANGSSTNSNPPSLNTGSSQKYLWIPTRSGDSTVQATATPSGYNGSLLIRTASGTGGASSALAWREWEGQTEDPGTFTSATEQWVSWTVAVAPAGGTPDISVSPTSYNFGVVQMSTTSNTTTSYFTITNSSSIQTDQTIAVTTSTWSGGVGWTHSDTGTPNTNQVGMNANKGGTWGTGDVLVKYASPNFIAENQAASTNYSFGLSLITPTSVTDGVQKSITVRITAAAG